MAKGDIVLITFPFTDLSGSKLRSAVVLAEYLFQVGNDKHTLKAGHTFFLPGAVPHACAQLTENGKMLFLFQPSGKMEII